MMNRAAVFGSLARKTSGWFTARRALRAGALVPCAVLAGLPVYGLLDSSIPLAIRLGIGALTLGTALRPTDGLLVLAGLAPLGGVIGIMTRSPYSLTEPMVLAFLCGWLTHETVSRPAPLIGGARRVLVPALLTAATVGASGIALLAAMQPTALPAWRFVGAVLSFTGSTYFEDWTRYPPLANALGFLEGLGVFTAAVVLTDRHPALAIRLVQMIAVGAIGVAGLSLNRLAEVALRSGGLWTGLWAHLQTIRISAAFGDLNAAGSYFAMALGLAIGAATVRGLWILATGPLVAALWLTGSRAALIASSISVVVMAIVRTVRPARYQRLPTRVLWAAGLMLVALAVVLVFTSGMTGRATLPRAWAVRLDLSKAAARMIWEHPLFGVGIGEFLPSSGAYLSPQVRELVSRENAHNNFLQVLAELGLVGGIPFAVLLVLVVRRLWSTIRCGAGNDTVLGTLGGLLAFLISCLAGHPLLVAEVRSAFWLLLGAAVGLTRGMGGGAPSQGLRGVSLGATRARQRARPERQAADGT